VDPSLREDDWALESLNRVRSLSDSKAVVLPVRDEVELIPIEKRYNLGLGYDLKRR